jgi:predicted nuclease of predicted toxin-antitoxin system
VRLLLDANLSPDVARRLTDAGHEAVHVVEIGLVTAADPEIMRAAVEEDLTRGAIVSMTRRHLRVRELPIDRHT